MRYLAAFMLVAFTGLSLAACDNSPNERAAYEKAYDSDLHASGAIPPASEGPLTGAPPRQ